MFLLFFCPFLFSSVLHPYISYGTTGRQSFLLPACVILPFLGPDRTETMFVACEIPYGSFLSVCLLPCFSLHYGLDQTADYFSHRSLFSFVCCWFYFSLSPFLKIMIPPTHCFLLFFFRLEILGLLLVVIGYIHTFYIAYIPYVTLLYMGCFVLCRFA